MASITSKDSNNNNNNANNANSNNNDINDGIVVEPSEISEEIRKIQQAHAASVILPYLHLGARSNGYEFSIKNNNYTHVLSVDSSCKFPWHNFQFNYKSTDYRTPVNYAFHHCPVDDYGSSNIESILQQCLPFIKCAKLQHEHYHSNSMATKPPC